MLFKDLAIGTVLTSKANGITWRKNSDNTIVCIKRANTRTAKYNVGSTYYPIPSRYYDDKWSISQPFKEYYKLCN